MSLASSRFLAMTARAPPQHTLLKPHHEYEKHRNEQHHQQGTADHAAKHAGADGVLGIGAGAVGGDEES